MQHAIGSRVTEPAKIAILYDTLRKWCPAMKQERFSGGHPVSITTTNLGLLQQHKHMVSVKADGVRCMALFLRVADRPVAVVHYRNGDFFRLNLRVTDGLLFDGTLIDMEQMQSKFMVFDVYVLRGNLIVHNRYADRVRIAEDLLDFIEGDIFEMKPVYKPSQLKDLVDALDDVKNDGLIITRDVPDTKETDWLWRRSNCMLKWKPTTTIDLYVDKDMNLFWSEKGALMPVRSLMGYAWNPLSEKRSGIHEFEMKIKDAKKISLKHLRARPDVSLPNDVSTVTLNLETVIDNIDFVTIQAVLGQIHIGKRVKYQ